MTWVGKFPTNKIALAWKQGEIHKKYTAVRGRIKEERT